MTLTDGDATAILLVLLFLIFGFAIFYALSKAEEF